MIPIPMTAIPVAAKQTTVIYAPEIQAQDESCAELQGKSQLQLERSELLVLRGGSPAGG